MTIVWTIIKNGTVDDSMDYYYKKVIPRMHRTRNIWYLLCGTPLLMYGHGYRNPSREISMYTVITPAECATPGYLESLMSPWQIGVG